jgi:DedD protein
MGLFSFSRKNQQQSSAGNSDFYSQADEETPASRKRRQGKKREEAVDPLLPQKKRARRRLIGAIALVLAVIIGLPMILDSEPKPLSGDIAIQIPSKEAVAPGAQSPHAAVKSGSPAAALDANEQIVEAPAAKPDQNRQSVAKPETAAPPPAAQNNSPESGKTGAAKAAAAASAVTAPDASAEAKKKAEDAARARAILEGKAPAANATVANATGTAKPAGKVVVQVAALSTQEKVDELQKKLKDAGLKSYTEKVNTSSGVWIRVRLGPFANDAAAEKVRAQLLKIGLNGKLLPA